MVEVAESRSSKALLQEKDALLANLKDEVEQTRLGLKNSFTYKLFLVLWNKKTDLTFETNFQGRKFKA